MYHLNEFINMNLVRQKTEKFSDKYSFLNPHLVCRLYISCFRYYLVELCICNRKPPFSLQIRENYLNDSHIISVCMHFAN